MADRHASFRDIIRPLPRPTKRLRILGKLALSAALALLVCLALRALAGFPTMRDAERRAYDELVNRGGYPPAPPYILIVDFDDRTVRQYGYPIPRTALADVIHKVEAGQPQVIGLDFVVSEPRTPAEDQALARAMSNANDLVLATVMPSRTTPAAEPLPEFCPGGSCGISNVGFVNFDLDPDGFVRRMYLTPDADYNRLPFAVVVADRYSGRVLRPGKIGAYRELQSASDPADTIRIPLDDTGHKTALIGSWGSLPPEQVISAADILAPNFSAGDRFRGKLVLMGQRSSAAKDWFLTPPFRARRPAYWDTGVDAHVAAIASLLAGRGIWIFSPRWNWAVCFAAIFLALSCILLLRPLYSVPLGIACAAATYGVAQYLLAHSQLWMKFAFIEAGLAIAIPLGFVVRFVEARLITARVERERAHLMGLFSRYVSPEVANEVWRRRGELVLAGEERVATVVFTDIRDFTRTTAGRPSNEVLAWLNEYFTAMARIVDEEHGFLNKFIGDGMMMVFGVPFTRGPEEDACAAIRAAQKMLVAVGELNRANAGDSKRPPIRIGIGIHTGLLTVGNVGSAERLEYSVIGETVNLASRLESLTKELKAEMVLSPGTYAYIKDRFSTAPLGKAAVRGFEGEMMFYTVQPAAAAGPARI